MKAWTLIEQIFIPLILLSFRTASTQAFGKNMRLVNCSTGLYGFYSGDVDQNGFINLSDIIIISNDAALFTTGYKVTDIT